jgi:lipopolysaccharide export system protein LptA
MKYKIIFITSIIITSYSYSQETKVIEIIQAGTSIRNSIEYPGATILVKDDNKRVILFHDGAKIESDISYYYPSKNSFKANGDVKFTQGDTLTMTSNVFDYDGIKRRAIATGNVKLVRPDMILNTDTLYLDRNLNTAYYNTNGTIIDNENILKSKVGVYFMDEKKYSFKSNVKINNPEYNVISDDLEYYTESDLAYFNGPSNIIGSDYEINSELGFYDTKVQKGFFKKNAIINYDGKIINGDSIYFENEKSYAAATNNIIINDTINNSIITGHYGEIFKSIDSAIVTKNALAVSVSKGDSLYIHSDTLTITGPDEQKILKGFYDVRIFKSDVRGKSDSIHYNQTNGLIKLLKRPLNQSIIRNLTDEEKNKKNPIVWFGKNQLTGDEIFLKSNAQTQELDSLLILGNVFMIQKDSISKDGYNQIKGEKLEGSFYDSKLENINVIKNSVILYYMHSDDGEDFLGLNKTLASSILIKFANNEISEVFFYKTPDGNIYSENNIIPNEKTLPGFLWRDKERPKSVEDLFSNTDKLLDIVEID